MYLIMAPLSPICFSHSDLFCTSPWSFSASYWWFCMFLWLFCVSLSVCGILHCIKVIFLTFWQKTFRSALQLTWWKLCPHCRGMALIPLQAIYCPALLTLLSSKMTDKKETVEKCLPIKFRVIMSCNIPLQFADIIVCKNAKISLSAKWAPKLELILQTNQLNYANQSSTHHLFRDAGPTCERRGGGGWVGGRTYLSFFVFASLIFSQCCLEG